MFTARNLIFFLPSLSPTCFIPGVTPGWERPGTEMGKRAELKDKDVEFSLISPQKETLSGSPPA